MASFLAFHSAGSPTQNTPLSAPLAASPGLAVLLAFVGWMVTGASGAQADELAPRAIPAPAAVIELFTSQGCSSCPPADKLLGKIASRQNVIALTLAVDYWDYLGWKDTLAKHGHSVRQKAYAKLRGDGKMFTPQAVVNGHAMAIGSDEEGLERSIADVPNLAVPVKLETAGGKLAVSVGAGSGAGEVWLCPVASAMEVDIGRGENEGAKVDYHNVVRGWTKLGDWKGEEARFEVPLSALQIEGVNAAAVLVQNGSSAAPGAIVGAALTPLP
ncbi:DUF1223 domain-containing protein [Ancylobacter sp. A5.8]|uniref:DUF1223 domain-containing protein n=1 Tax=Ancylobacter gelatini TaxID=2919920 RepID=UPI001F4DA207|nr:DUF1223 domain-containing protein [Ancylobacter gelatini]MCJ8144539.1 DUF1223 domain-containing protein [Ancylobacter gelatini]